MIAGEENKPSLDELAHYGVKGMRWRVQRGGQTRLPSWMEQSPRTEQATKLPPKKPETTEKKTANVKAVVEPPNKVAPESTAIQIKNRQNRVKFGATKLRDILAKHRATKYKDMVSDQ